MGARGPIFKGMKNREPNRYPTPEELYALERAARRARSEAVAELLRAAARGVKRLVTPATPKGLRHA
jgi:hypothetical protein